MPLRGQGHARRPCAIKYTCTSAYAGNSSARAHRAVRRACPPPLSPFTWHPARGQAGRWRRRRASFLRLRLPAHRDGGGRPGRAGRGGAAHVRFVYVCICALREREWGVLSLSHRIASEWTRPTWPSSIILSRPRVPSCPSRLRSLPPVTAPAYAPARARPHQNRDWRNKEGE
jgi:hypothetical protein